MNPITSPIARATARSSIIERNPIVRLGFRLIATKYWLPRPDRTLQRLFPDGNRFAGSLSFRRMTSSLPSTRPTADQRWRRASRSQKCTRRCQNTARRHRGHVAGRTVRAPYLTLLCQSTHDFLVPIEPVSSWGLVWRSQYKSVGEALNTSREEKEASYINFSGELKMRVVSTALVMMAIALMLLALMLLTPSVRANPMTFVANLAGHESPSNSSQTTGIENAHPPKKIPSPPESRMPIDRMP
jgi:hypothetical protein